MKHLLLVFLFVIMSAFKVSADRLVINKDDTLSSEKKSKVRVTPLPVISYAPETRLGLGALGIFNFCFGKDSSTRTSYIQSSFVFTINKQIDCDNEMVAFSNKEKFLIKAHVRYMYMPEYYYGVGNNLPSNNQQLINYTRFFAEARVLKQIRKNIFTGLYLRSNDIINPSPVGQGIWQRQPYLGQNGYHISGVGVNFVADSRDLVYNASKGFFTEFYALLYGKYTGSNYSMAEVSLDVRKYFNVWKAKRHVLGFQLWTIGTAGDVPYKDLTEFGGGMMMRGYYRGRYRDKNLASFQMEYRMPVWKFIGLCAWGGAGRVASRLSDFSFAGIKPDYGMGLRFQISKKDKINVRLDYGVGSKTTGIYLDILEAF